MKSEKQLREQLGKDYFEYFGDRENPGNLIRIAKDFCRLGNVTGNTKYYKKAVAYLEAIKPLVDLNDKKTLNWYLAGIWQYKLGKPRQAIKCLEKSLIRGNNQKVFEFLSQFHEELGEYEIAREYSLKSQNIFSREKEEELGEITEEEIERVKQELDKL